MKFNWSNFQGQYQQQGGIYPTFRSEQNPLVNMVMGILFFIISIGAYPAKLFFRENMGERALRIIDPLVYVSAFFALLVSTTLINLAINTFIVYGNLKEFFEVANLVLSFPFLSCCFIFWLVRESYRYFKNNFDNLEFDQRTHSFHRGQSRLFKNIIGKTFKNKIVQPYHVRAILEPLMAVNLGLAILILDPTLGLAFIIAGICLFIDERYIIQKRRDSILDALDTEMDAVFLQKYKKLFRNLQEKDVNIDELKISPPKETLFLKSEKKKKTTPLIENDTTSLLEHKTETEETESNIII